MKILKPKHPITIQLTEEEATVLCALVGGIVWNFDTKSGQVVREFFECLDKHLPNRKKSFTDFFEGEVRVAR